MMLDKLRELDVWTRVLLCAVTGVILWVVTAGWSPSFPYRARQASLHNLHARAEFEYYDAVATSRARAESRRTALVHYSNDPRALDDLQTEICTRISARHMGRQVQVLVESRDGDRWRGRTRTNKLVFFEDERELAGQLVDVDVTWTGPWSMIGRASDAPAEPEPPELIPLTLG